MLTGEADIYTHKFSEAERSLNDAARLCDTSASASCGYVIQARGILADEQGQSASAERLYELSLAFARSRGDLFLESDSLLNLGNESLGQGHYDEAIDKSEAAYQIAKAEGFQKIEIITQGNIAWAYYKLGDLEKALELSEETEKLASQLGDVSDQENELTNIGYIYLDERKFDMAAQSFQQALGLAQKINAREDIYNALRVLARLSLQTDDLASASQYAQRAAEIARQDGNHLDELYPMLVQGQIAARRGNPAEAEATFQRVERDKICPVSLKWEAEHSLARIYEDENRPDFADREYRAALATFEAARDTVRHEDSQLSFLTNAWHIYDDFVHFLVTGGKTDDALRWADYSRARTLAEGLGLTEGNTTGPLPLNAQSIAQRAHATVLFYWLGEKQSYLWAITPQKTRLFTLAPGPEIEAAAERYRDGLSGPQDVLEAADEDGRWLYRTLIVPAQDMLPADAKVVVIPDGKLNNLNFETLLVSGSRLHYWIEDATIVNANKLRLLAAPYAGKLHAGKEKRVRSLLLIGNAVAPDREYPELPNAALEMTTIAKHFPAGQQRVFQRDQATPAAYLASNPEQFSYIHFVAHGMASRLSPLDSAIVLSKDSSNDETFKLHASDIIQHRLRAELVTISACYGAGTRVYSGEGLVGLSWAFLRAGAHNVIAALWDASDVSTGQLMDKFYDELNAGKDPDAALRRAKLSLLHSDSAFRRPFYWAPFQLYAGS
jgi:CHAT domain-containing protein/Flp pilus assembly protein TadD